MFLFCKHFFAFSCQTSKFCRFSAEKSADLRRKNTSQLCKLKLQNLTFFVTKCSKNTISCGKNATIPLRLPCPLLHRIAQPRKKIGRNSKKSVIFHIWCKKRDTGSPVPRFCILIIIFNSIGISDGQKAVRIPFGDLKSRKLSVTVSARLRSAETPSSRPSEAALHPSGRPP